MTTRRRLVIARSIVLSMVTVATQAYAEQSDKPTDTPTEARSAVAFRWREHPGLRLGRHVRLEATARLEGDMRAAELDADTDWARRRVGLNGELWKRFSFSVERELADETEPWRDVYLNVALGDWLEVRAGHFKLPFGAEQLTSAVDVPFAQRALISDNLAPGRDTGVMLHGKVWRKRLAYRAGYFTRDGRQARTRTSTGGRDAGVARIVVAPFRGARGSAQRWANIQVGVGVATSRLDEGAQSVDGRTALFERRFFEPLFVQGQRLRIGTDVTWRLPRVAFMFEGTRVRDARTGQGLADDSLPALVSDGWVGSTVWTLRSGGRWRGTEGPRLGVFDDRAGAIELTARVESLRFATPGAAGEPFLHPRSPRIPTVEVRALTVGANWYPLPFARLQADAVREWSGTGSLASGALRQRPVWGGHIRLQVGL